MCDANLIALGAVEASSGATVCIHSLNCSIVCSVDTRDKRPALELVGIPVGAAAAVGGREPRATVAKPAVVKHYFSCYIIENSQAETGSFIQM